MIILQVMIVLLSMASCNKNQQKCGCGKAENATAVKADSNATFEAFKQHFGKTAAFAYVNMSGRNILLVSHETFGNNVNTDLEAIETSIFALDKEGKIVALGSIRSQGTLYPVSLLNGKLMVAGHQFVKVYGIRADIPELTLDNYEEGESPKLTEMFRMFETGTPIKFEKK